MPPPETRRRIPAWPFVVLLLAIHYAIGITSVLNKSCSCDEIAYLTAGYTYWQTCDFRMVPEHPPLTELWASLPLNFMSLKMPSLDQKSWWDCDQWRFGWEWFYELGNPLQRMLVAGRAMIGLFSVALGLTIYLVSSRWFGRMGGFISLGIFTFAPEMLAHGFQITTDTGATLFFLLSLLSVWWAMNRVSLVSVLFSGLALGALFISKFSAVLMIPLYGVFLLIHCLSSRPTLVRVGKSVEIHSRGRKLGVQGLVFTAQVLIVATVIWVSHGSKYPAFVHATPGVDRLQSMNPDRDSRQPYWDYELYRFGKLSPVVRFARDHKLLPEAYLYGFLFAMNMTSTSEAFLNGVRNTQGFRIYFPYAFLIKTSLPALVLMLLGLTLLWRKLHRRDVETPRGSRPPPTGWDASPLLLFLVLYWATAILSRFNIGHRHILPIYPPLMIFAGAIAAYRLPKRFLATVATVAIMLHAGVCLTSWPHYLSFFNSIVGGSKNGYQHLVDSSVDWGQDLAGLADWLRTHNPPTSPDCKPIFLSYLGNGSPEYYGVHAKLLPSNAWWQQDELFPLTEGLYCVSGTMIEQVFLLPEAFWTVEFERLYQLALPRIRLLQEGAWPQEPLPGEEPAYRLPADFILRLRFGRLCALLRQREPNDEVGHSILIYRVSKEELEKAIFGPPPELHPDTPKSIGELGDALSKIQPATLAAEYYRRAIELDPDNERCHHNLGALLGLEKKYDESIKHLREALRLWPNYPEGHSNLASVLTKAGRFDEALPEYEEAIRLRPNWPEAQTNLAGLMVRLHRHEEAIRLYVEALRLSPNWPAIHNSLGISLAQLDRYEEAVASFQEALRQKPGVGAVYVNLGNAQLRLGCTEEAIQHFQEALRLGSVRAEVHTSLGVALARQGRLDAAIEQFNTAIRLKPTLTLPQYHLAQTLTKQGKVQEALGQCRKVIQSRPNDAEPHFQLAELLQQAKRNAEAEQEYRETLRMNPHHTGAAKRLSEITSRHPASTSHPTILTQPGQR